MKGLTPDERRLLIDFLNSTPCTSGVCPEGCISEADYPISAQLCARGLTTMVDCSESPDEYEHARVTPLGRLALHLDAAARGNGLVST